MRVRQATADDVDPVMELVRRVVPVMRASGNFQWDETYPNAVVFARDVEAGQLWLAEIDEQIAGVAAITTAQDPEYAQVGWDLSETLSWFIAWQSIPSSVTKEWRHS